MLSLPTNSVARFSAGKIFCGIVATAVLLFTVDATHALQVINLFPGDAISDNTVITSGTTVNVLGGTIGLGVDLANGELNVNSGTVATGASSIATGFTNSNNDVTLNGGTIGGFFQLTNSTDFEINGGQIESFGVFSGSTATINGGVVTRFPDIFSSGEVNISGGDIFAVRVFDGGEVNFFGTEFFLDGQAVTGTLGQEIVIGTRNVTLTGTLADGSAIETDLNTAFGEFFSDNPDGAGANALVTVTLLEAIPEPSSTIFGAFLLIPLLKRRRS